MSAFRGSLEAVMAWWDAAGADVPDVPKPMPAARNTQNRTAQNRAPQSPVKASNQARSATPSSANLDERIDAAKALAAGASTLEELQKAIAGFDAGPLSDRAQNAVFARGNPAADIMIIGESPGRDDDIEGKPFVGRAGRLLDKMFASIDLTEDQLYITNVINWRLPKNRAADANDIAICLPLITRHIQLAAPKVLVLVGSTALSALTPKTGIMKMRGQWQDVSMGEDTLPALPLYHPDFLLKRPELKRDAWHDLIALRRHVDHKLAF